MTLRDRLAGKARRHHDHRVATGDTTVAARQLAHAQQLALAAQLSGDPAAAEAARAEVAAAEAAFEGCFDVVGFDALDPDAYEALIAPFVDEAGEVDRDGVLPHLAAACACDEDLRDVEWWAAQLGSGRWNAGEVDDLFAALVDLNYAVPGPGLGKG